MSDLHEDDVHESGYDSLRQEFDRNWFELLHSAYCRLDLHVPSFLFLLLLSTLFGAIGYAVVNSKAQEDFFVELFSILTNVYASLLGFAIAGYALFAVLGESRYLNAIMAHRVREKYGSMPLLKIHLLCLVKFLVALGIGLIVFLTALILAYIHRYTDLRLFTLNQLFINELGTFSGMLIGFCIGIGIVEAKSFIFNIYNIALTHAFFYYQEAADDDSEKDCFVQS